MARLPFRLLNNWASVVVLVLLLGLPIYGPFMVYAEGDTFPVTSNIVLTDIESADGGLSLRFTYEKYRECELVGTAWLVGKTEVEFHPISGIVTTRIVGQQQSRKWFLGASTGDFPKSTAWFLHRCHPFWITATKVFG